MYIIKNAFRCIGRSKGRNILIGIIALVIAISACIGLSIRQASENAKATALEGLSITATISYDRANAMGQLGGGRPGGFSGGGGFDKDQFADIMGNATSLTLDEYHKYAEASCVQDFYGSSLFGRASGRCAVLCPYISSYNEKELPDSV